MLTNFACTFRSLVANSEDSLQSPLLHFENVARLKRLMDAKNYCGPVSIGGDCTKVRSRLTYSNDFGSHVLGSTLPLDECEVHECEDIDKVIDHIKSKKATASQTRAIMAKVRTILFAPLISVLNLSRDTSSRITPFRYCLNSSQRQRQCSLHPRAQHENPKNGSTAQNLLDCHWC
jgi:hypothetical protein